MSDTVTITGNVASDPKQITPNGVPITSFRLASSQRRRDGATGEWVDSPTNWFSVSAFRGLGEHALASLRKGDRIIVTGRLRIRDWSAGERSGTSAEIDAESLGHDLLWGTTVFTRASGGGGHSNLRALGSSSDDANSSGGLPHDGAAKGAVASQWHVPMPDDAESMAAESMAAGSGAAGTTSPAVLQAMYDVEAPVVPNTDESDARGDVADLAMALADEGGQVTPF